MEKKETPHPRPKSPKQNKPSTTSVNNNSAANGTAQVKGSPSRQSKLSLVQGVGSQRAVSNYPGMPPNPSIRQQLSGGPSSSQAFQSNGNVRYSLSRPHVQINGSRGSFLSQNFQNYSNFDSKASFPKPVSQMLGNRANTSKSLIGIDRSRNMRAYVEKAIAERKVFTCVGVYPAIKNALKKRGWVEKTGPLTIVRSANASLFRDTNNVPDDESDQAWISRNLRDYPPDFIWVIRRDNIDWKNLHSNQVINRFPKAWFTTKVGLVACLQQMHWFSEAGVADTFFPRCYRLCLEDERQAFQEDFRLTACMSYLRHFIESYENKGSSSMIDPASKITPLSIDFASRQLGNYIRMRRHEDIDWLLPPNFMSQHWEAFIHQYYLVVHEKKKIRFDSQEAVKTKYEMAKKTLNRIGQYWPQAHLDGVFNMWICKPGARSRGKGIVIMNTLEKIMDLLNHTNYRESNWVVQKYMERPMLIYKTKFDIRQWFIITDWSPLTVWFYKESYVRFCTKPYVLEDFHESIHLCNNAIQCRYQNSELRDTALPDENMWDCYTFQAYLKTIGKMEQWPAIYSGMKQAIIGVLLASQETVESKKGCFELYGADFMLSEDCKPWLIEINSCPCMASSTSVTARMCAQCLEDCVKVVIDRKANKNADTGMFEMIYRQNPSSVTVQQFSGHDLIIHGKKLTRDIDWPSMMGNRGSASRRNLAAMSSPLVRQPSIMPQVPENLTFADLLQKLRMKNAQMFANFTANSQSQTVAALTVADGSDKTLTGTLINKMRTLNKTPNSHRQDLIEGMKKVYPNKAAAIATNQKPTVVTVKQETNKPQTDVSLAFLSKYSNNNSNTFADLVRMGQQLAQESENDQQKRPGTSANAKRVSTPNRNPYLPNSPESGGHKTLSQVRVSMAATLAESEKYGKIRSDLASEIETAYTNNNNITKCIERSDSSDSFSDSSSNYSDRNLETPDNNFPTSDYGSSSKTEGTDSRKGNEIDENESGVDQSPVSTPISPSSPLPSSLSETQLLKKPDNQNISSVYMVYPAPPKHDHNPDNPETELYEPEPENPDAIQEPESTSISVDDERKILIDFENDAPVTSRPDTPVVDKIPEGNADYDDIQNNNNNIVFPEFVLSSSESDSLSDGFDFSDPDLNRLFIPASSRSAGSCAVSFDKPRTKSLTKPRIPKFSKFPCHRVTLSQNSLKLSGRRSGATLPLKKINLKLS